MIFNKNTHERHSCAGEASEKHVFAAPTLRGSLSRKSKRILRHSSHLRVRYVINHLHPEVRALASLEGLVQRAQTFAEPGAGAQMTVRLNWFCFKSYRFKMMLVAIEGNKELVSCPTSPLPQPLVEFRPVPKCCSIGPGAIPVPRKHRSFYSTRASPKGENTRSSNYAILTTNQNTKCTK